MDNLDELVIDFVTAQNGRKDYYAGRNIAAEMKAIEDGMRGVANESEKMGDKTEKGTKKVVRLRSEMKKTTTQAQLLSRAFRFLGGFIALNKLKDYADDWTQITSQLRLLTDTEEERVALQERLYKLSQDTRNSTKETVDLYAKLTMNAASLNLSQEKRLQLTELINKSLVAGGGSTEDNKRVLLQFGQALGIGRFQGQDLKSIMQSNIGFAKTIAEGLGVDVGQLTEMGARGELTSDKVVNAILKQQDKINEQYSKTSATLKQSLGSVNDAFMKFIGDTDEAFGVSQKLAKGLEFLAKNIRLVANVLLFAFIPSLLRATPILGSFIVGASKGYSAMTVFKRGLVTAIPILKSFAKTVRLAFNIYLIEVLIKLLRELWKLFTGKENIFEEAWMIVFDKIEERLGKLPDDFKGVLNEMAQMVKEWYAETKLGKFFGYEAPKPIQDVGQIVGKSMPSDIRDVGEIVGRSFSTNNQNTKNITQNQNFNITVNEASQGITTVEKAVGTAVRQATAGIGAS